MKIVDKQINAEEYYHTLQTSRYREHAFEEWKEYRDDVTELVKTCFEPLETIAILGAGRCNDVDISVLADYFKEVVLLDINTEAMEDALEKYHLKACPNIQLRKSDFVGIPEDGYIQFTKELFSIYSSEKSEPEKNADALHAVENLYRLTAKYQVDIGEHCYDNIVAIGINSQLNDTAMWIWSSIMELFGEKPDVIHHPVAERINIETLSFVKRFNDAIFRACRKKVLFGYETGISGQLKLVQGAVQTREDLMLRQLTGAVKKAGSKAVLWPYDKQNNIIFSMNMEILAL